MKNQSEANSNTKQARVADHPKSDSSPGLRVLVADDESDHARILCSQLAELGHVIVGPVSDGAAAIELCMESSPDLAMLDVRMPHQNGIEAADVIFREFGTPVVILSAVSQPEFIARAGDAGVFGYLVKPVSIEQLQAGISICMQRWEERMRQQDEVHVLRRRLEERRVIEQAKWKIVSMNGLSEPESLRGMQQHARRMRRSLFEVARNILHDEFDIEEIESYIKRNS